MDNRAPWRGVAVALLALFWVGAASAQSIFTVAGGGTTDGRQATDIGLFGVNGLAFDGKRNLYISESQRHVIQRVNLATGVIEVFAGNGGGSFGGDGGPARRASLMQPRGITFDDAGNLYIADSGNRRVRKVDAQSGVITTFAGSDQAPLDGVSGLDWHAGSLYATLSNDGGAVLRIAADGTITKLAGTSEAGFEGDGGPAKDAKLNEPFGIVVDPNGNIYIADGANAAVRRIDAATGKIETVVGRGNPADEIGDNLPGTQAKLVRPTGLAFDAAGRLYIADAYNTYGRIRRWDPVSKIVTTVVGNGQYHEGDGGPVSGAGLYAPFAVAVDADQNLYVHDGANESVRVVGAASQIINRIAGGGSFIGDGLLARSAILRGPRGVAVDAAGNLFIADAYETLVRKVDASTGVISTFAGRLYDFYAGDDQDGKPAVEASVGAVNDVAILGAEVFIADPHSNKIWRVDTQGKIFTYAGGGAEGTLGDGAGAIGANISPQGISFDAAGNLYIADADGNDRHRIRKVDAQTKIITTVAGSAAGGYSGDNGQATAAQLQAPVHAVVDAAGNIFIADRDNAAIRRVDAATKVITTYAGRGNPPDGIGDGLPATSAALTPVHMAIDRATGDLYVADNNTHRVRKIDGQTRIITTVAGSGTSYLDADFSGDNGPATAAKLNLQYELSGVARDARGNLYIGDTLNNRVRAVLACGSVTAPQLTQPGNGVTGTTTAPALSWNAVAGAFRYDVFLDTVADPQTIVATDTDETRFTPANLAPNTKYYWKVRAKGDPFCPAATATSAVFSFTTAAGCGVGSFDLIAPAGNATNVASPVTLSWQAAAGAASYDVYLGTVSPPPLFQAGVTQTSLQVTPGRGTNYWTVVAHAACDDAKTATAPVRSFTVQSGGTCSGPAAVELLAPAAGATGVAAGTTLTWQATGCATAPFDVYFGTASDPPLLSANVAGTSQAVTSLAPSTTYFWRVAGRNQDGAGVSSATRSFTTQSCAAPGATAITFAPPSVAAGTTYALVWQAASDLDPQGGYLVERSSNASFSGADSQLTTSTSATFIAESAGTLYHRVRAVPSCDPRQTGPVSETRAVVVTAARPNVIFTVQPSAVVVEVGDKLEEIQSTFTLENLGTENVRVGVGRQELGSSPPFFSIFDPLGNDIFVTLEPRRPRTFSIRYGGPSTATAGSYQGVIYVAGESLPIIPYAFVELRVGGEGSATPRFELNGSAVEFVSIPGHTGDASIEVGIRNTGSTPMELAAEVGPEVWLVPEKGWNDSQIAPGTVRTVRLNTRRAFAPNGSPLPRYTYLTVRTKDGAKARLLVQDNDATSAGNGRSIALRAEERAFIVPEATSRNAVSGGFLVTRLRLTNAGSDAVQAELIFTPASTDGFSAQGVKRATVVIPPNDVVTLTDPLVQVLALQRPAGGQLEVRVPRERLGLISVNAATTALTGGAAVQLPTLARGAGARRGVMHAVHGLTENADTTTSLVLVETSGIAGATVRVRLFESNGTARGEATYPLLRYGYRRIDDLLPSLGVNQGTALRLDVSIESGEGSVAAVAIVRDRPSERGVAFVSTPVASQTEPLSLMQAFESGPADPAPHALPNITIVVPVLGSPSAAGNAAIPSYKTLLQFIAAGGPSIFNMAFRGADGVTQKTLPPLNIPTGLSVVFEDTVAGLFALNAGAVGSVSIEATNGGKVSAVLQAAPTPAARPVVSSKLPLISSLSEAITAATSGSQRPLFLDGLEQSTDPTLGSRWQLLLNEVGGASGRVTVRLFESGNRTQPIAAKDFPIGAYQQLTLDTVFRELGLDSPERKKDRTNVQIVVVATSGAAKVAASAVAIDNRSGETKVHELLPGGYGSLVTAITPTLPASGTGKRRGVRHP